MSAHNRVLPIKEWPASDQHLWHRAIKQGGLFDEVGPLSHLAGPALDMIRAGYGKWVTWLADTHPTILRLSPEEHFEPERFLAFSASHAGLSPHTRYLYAANTLRLVRPCFPNKDWDVFLRIGHHLLRQARDHSSTRKGGRILDGGYVLTKALELARSQADSAVHAKQKALIQRNGTIIAFLTLIPLRRRAFTGLRIGSSVVFEGNDILIALSPEMNKTKTYWETLVPEVLSPALRHYMQEVRPWLMAQGNEAHDHLWVTKEGAPLTGTAMGTLVRNATSKLLGVDLSVHLFRDIAATTLARRSPEAAGHIRALLGHSSHETAEKHYNQATALEVGREHACLLGKIKRGV